MRTNKDLLECLMFTVNEKVITAAKNAREKGEQYEFHWAQQLAYQEVYTMLTNMLEHETE